LVTQRADDAVTVPVAALHDGPDERPSVSVVENGVTTVRSVSIGLVAEGWAQVTSGLRAGEHVQLPGA
jgi:multidrug efflux pump subunit AcrA (membrane-fusion protein)